MFANQFPIFKTAYIFFCYFCELKLYSSTMKKKNNAETSDLGNQKPEKLNIFKQIYYSMHNDTFMFILGAVLVVVSIFLIGSYISFFFSGGTDQSALEALDPTTVDFENGTGSLGAKVADTMINKWFGLASCMIPVFMAILGVRMMKLARFNVLKWFISCSFLMIWFSIFLHLVLSGLMQDSFIMPGGNHGMNVTNWLTAKIGAPGMILALMLTMLFYSIYLTRRTIEWIRGRVSSIKDGIKAIEKDNDSKKDKAKIIDATDPDDNQETDIDTDDITTNSVSNPHYTGHEEEPIIEDEEDEIPEKKPIPKSTDEIKMEIIQAGEDETAHGRIQEPYDPRLDLSHYKFPTLDLLKKYDDNTPSIDEKEQMDNKERIIRVLRNFSIEIDSITATVGPTITLYEITPAAGVRISKIRNLEDDIALSLSALGIRIIAPIPGKGTIGIEVPNAKPLIVSMQSIISSKRFAESKMELPVVLGKTITNEVFMFDLAKMPHLLVAGATGQGKSVGLNAIITSLLYKKHPAELKLVMVDPKMVEFSIYSPIVKHFLAKMPDEKEAIITDTTKVVHTLKSLCIEMDDRYDLLRQANVRVVTEYNRLFIERKLNPEKGHRFMPYIVVIIDEFGDLIMTAGKDIEMPIARIAQKARAVGIHMIIATQRPTTNIITGNIKANFPARMAFRVTSMIDSRTILDRTGANQLVGRGDLLFLQGSDPVRIQCAFVDTPEVQNICQFISSQQGYTEAYQLPEYVDETENGTSSAEGIDSTKLDPLFEDAARLIITHQQGSTSLIQRKFAIGYNRAGRLMDQLERAGIVGRAEGSKPRQVLCMDEMDLNKMLQNMNN